MKFHKQSVYGKRTKKVMEPSTFKNNWYHYFAKIQIIYLLVCD